MKGIAKCKKWGWFRMDRSHPRSDLWHQQTCGVVCVILHAFSHLVEDRLVTDKHTDRRMACLLYTSDAADE